MAKQTWKGSTLLNPEPPVLVSCGSMEAANLITIGWTGTICTQPSMVSISVAPIRSPPISTGNTGSPVTLPENSTRSVSILG